MSRPLPLDLLNLRMGSIPAAMSSPPVITRGVTGAVSTLNGNAVTSPTALANSGKVVFAHGTVAYRTLSPVGFAESNTINYGGGTFSGNCTSMRWMTDAPEFEIPMREAGGTFILYVDGQPNSLSASTPTRGVGDLVYYKFSFGADTLTYQSEAAVITAGGSGYAVGDIITVTGGTSTVSVQVMVVSISGSAAAALRIVEPGNYSVAPTTAMSQGSTTGSGTGATITMTWGERHTTRGFRRLEFVWGGNISVGGVNVPSGCCVLPWPVAGEPWVFVGDSYTEGSFTLLSGQTWDEFCALSLGVRESSISYGMGSIGYVTTSGSRPNFLQMVPDLIAINPTRMVVALGINDGSQTDAAIEANVIAGYSQLMAALPNCLFFCLGPWSGKNVSPNTARVSAVVQAAFEATVPAYRGTFCNIVSDGLQQPDGTAAPATPGSGNSGQWISSDGTHPGTYGQFYLGYGAANSIYRGAQRILAA